MHNSTDIAKEITEKAKKLHIKVDAIGMHATKKVPVADKNDTIGDVKRRLLESTKAFDTINYIYVLSKKGKLKGVLSIREVLRGDVDQKVSKVMQKKDLIVAHPNTDREKVAHIALKNSLKAVPIVDDKNTFLGVVPSDSILSILDQESEEDLLKFAGIILGENHPEEQSNLPVYKSFISRIPWIVFGMVGGTITATLIGNFQSILSQNLILASFIPLVAYVANAVGNQTQMVLIRDLAVRTKIDTSTYWVKQFIISILIAFACWLTIILITSLVWQETYLGVVVGLSIFIAIITATFLAMLIPYTLKKLRFDPAIGSGPFTTVIQDLLSIMIYFTIASMML